MAKKVWNDPIDKNVDWGGDESTEGLPVSGEMIQQFIKQSLDGKAGLFYYDTTNNRYMVFADEVSRDEYLEDPTKTYLLLGTFDAPFNYEAEIHLISDIYNAVFLGSKGHYLDFTFDIKNKQGISTGENVNITYTFIRNSVKKVVRETRRHGDAVHFCVDDYIDEGTNTIIVGISGQTSLAATTASITYQVVNLQLTDETDISRVYNLSNRPQIAEVPFTVSGYGTKIMEWYLDGVQLEYVKAEDEVVDVSATRTKFITLLNLQQGRHSLQMRAYTLINGERFYTDTLYRDLMVYTGADSNLIIGAAATIPRAYGVLGASDGLAIYDMVQYIPYTLRFATYSPSNAAHTEVSVIVDGDSKGTIGSVNGIENEFSLVSNTSGTKSLVLQAGDVSYEIGLVVADTTMDLEEITNALEFDFNALGKSNNSSDKDSWSYGEYTGTFSGFNWNPTSGWVNDRLEINAGASFAVDYAPLSGTPTSLGKTIEMEWSTKNVINDDAIICDLRGSDGTGILITATKVSLISKGGVVIETEYKSNENVRVGFVINRASGSINQRLSFIYANGIVTRSEAWAATDSYASDAEIAFTATEEAEISLKAIRVYDSALTNDQMLNNFILYRDSVSDMMSIYNRNDVYEEGTTTFSPEKMSSRLPVMIVTGDIPTLENTSDKDTQIVVDIEYTNMQDPTRNFKMVGAAMRPQGTSSMGYPKKNFRIYTQKVDSTKVYDHEDKLIEDKLYAFKQGSQPVNCWCLKADYAESSGTHNTGIARLWNKALYDARVTYSFGDGDSRNVNNATVLRTNAQQMAVNNGYPYDVRTAIDGFPILLFYRPSANDDLIFIGKYNFNNDKSTESVFGFTFPEGVGMDEWITNYGSTMQCWEILNNGNDLALFTTVEGFDSGWSEAFEGRYPDKNTNVANLKTFCTWMSSVSDANFATEKWEHLDVYKMAAYWVYLMRHAGADQFVKNAMFTSEDGVKWYFILYDNDTINGLINTGRLGINPTDDRQTIDTSGAYVFAGHDSRLWNMLEADDEFMSIVASVDNALYSAGISYINAIRMFDDEQADKWVERVYNQDAQYKYIGTFVDDGINNLFMLQGKRDLHRRWWLAKRYSIFDAKYISGTYKSQAIELKCINGTEAGQKFTVTAGYPLEYGYGINNLPRESGIALDIDESHTFTTTEVVNLGDPIRIYGAPNIKELDLSEMASRLTQVNIAGTYDAALGTMLEKLVIGKANMTNNAEFAFSGLPQATKLEYLDVQGIKGITSLDLSNQLNFKTLIATSSNVSSVQFAKGAPVERIEIPASMISLHLEQLPYLTYDNIISESNFINITDINIKGCPSLSNNFDWVYTWYEHKRVENAKATLVMDNIDWQNVDYRGLLALVNIGTLSLKGKVKITEGSQEIIDEIKRVFGDNVFNKTSDFYVQAPDGVYLSGPSKLLEGESTRYRCAVFSEEEGRIQFSLPTSRQGCSIDAITGLLTTTENGLATSDIVVRALFISASGKVIETSMTVTIEKRTYPTAITIEGDALMSADTQTYTLTTTPSDVTGLYTVNWALDEASSEYLEIESYSNLSCSLRRKKEGVTEAVISATITKNVDGSTIISTTKNISLAMEGVVITKSSNAPLQECLYKNGLVAHEDYSEKWELALITADQLQPGTTLQTSIFYNYNGELISADELKYFIGVTSIKDYTFYACQLLKSITLPEGITSIGKDAFSICAALKSITLPEGITSIGSGAFSGCSSLTNIVIPNGVTYINNSAFSSCSALTSITLHEGITTLGDYAFQNCTSLTSIDIPNSVTTINSYAFRDCTSLKSITLPEGITVIETYTFYGCSSLTNIVIPSKVTKIDIGAFSKCTSLTSIDIPNSVTTFGYEVFSGCSSLTSIVIPSKVTTIGSSLVSGCSALTSIVVESGNTRYDSRNNCNAIIETEYNSLRAGCASTIIPNGVVRIDDSAFRGTSLTSIVIPNSVTIIGKYAFQDCTSLTSIDIPNSVTTIDNSAFQECSALTSIVIPNSVTTISDSLLSQCTSLTSITIPEGVTVIKGYAFQLCSSLTSIVIPSSVTSIGGSVFRDCTSLKSITIHRSSAPTVGGNYAFGRNLASYTGRNTYNTGENTLYVPQGATGYDAGQWLDPLQNAEKCGFTISYTL